MRRKWLGADEVEAQVRQVLKIPKKTPVGVKNANFAKIKTQKFFVTFDSKTVLATFFARPSVARKESLILTHLKFPKKLYLKDGLLIREKVEGVVLSPWGCSDDVLVRLARLLLSLGGTPVSDELKKHRLSFSQMKRSALEALPAAVEAFTPFRGSKGVFDCFAQVLSLDWQKKLRQIPRGFVHGDFQPQNILLDDGKISLIDFDRGGYFYPLFDVASFAVQFNHAALLENYHKGEKLDRREIRRRVRLFVKEYRVQGGEVDEEVFRLFKLLIIFNGLAFSTAGFRKKVARGYKHILFGLFRQELKWFAGRKLKVFTALPKGHRPQRRWNLENRNGSR